MEKDWLADAPNCTGERLLAQDGSKLVEFDQEMAHFAEKQEKHFERFTQPEGINEIADR